MSKEVLHASAALAGHPHITETVTRRIGRRRCIVMKCLAFAVVGMMTCGLARAGIIQDGSGTTDLADINTGKDETYQKCSYTSKAGVVTLKVDEKGMVRKYVMYDTDVGDSPGSLGVYTVSCDFLPAADDQAYRGGVVGWLDISSAVGIGLYVKPKYKPNKREFRLCRMKFDEPLDANNENYKNLYELNGDPVSGGFNVGGWKAASWATFQLDFQAPTDGDKLALPGATARVVASVYQGGTQLVSRTVLTDLPLPAFANHKVGYMGYLSHAGKTGNVGSFDNLNLTVVPKPGLMTLWAGGGVAFFLLLRRQRRR